MGRISLLPQMLFLYCHIVTLSHLRGKAMKWFVSYAWQQCDKENFIVTRLTYCISAHYLIRDNVTTKKIIFTGREQVRFLLFA